MSEEVAWRSDGGAESGGGGGGGERGKTMNWLHSDEGGD